MKRNLLNLGIPILILANVVIFSACQNQMTAKKIAAKCAKAMGGIGKIEELKTLRLAMLFPDHAGVIQYKIMRPNKIRFGDQYQIVFDGKQASWLEYRTGDGTIKKPEPIPQEEWKDFEIDIAWYIPAFFDYPSEYLGMEKVKKTNTHKLKVQLPLGGIMFYYLDADTYLIKKISALFEMHEKTYQPERIYSEYQTHEGILYPRAFTYEGRTGIFTATVTEIEFNFSLADDYFDIPEEAEPTL